MNHQNTRPEHRRSLPHRLRIAVVAGLAVLTCSAFAAAQDRGDRYGSYRDRGDRYQRATGVETSRARTRTLDNTRREFTPPASERVARDVRRDFNSFRGDDRRFDFDRSSYRHRPSHRSSSSLSLHLGTGYHARPYHYTPAYSPYRGHRDYGYDYRRAYTPRYTGYDFYDGYRPAPSYSTTYSYTDRFGGYSTSYSTTYSGYRPYRYVQPYRQPRVSFDISFGYGVPGFSYFPRAYCPPPRPVHYRHYDGPRSGTSFSVRYHYGR